MVVLGLLLLLLLVCAMGTYFKNRKKAGGGWGGGRSASPPMHSLQGMFEGNPFQMSTWRSFVVVVAVGGCGGGGAYSGLRSLCGRVLEGATLK